MLFFPGAVLCGALAPLPIVVRRAGDALLIEVRHEDQPPKILQRPVTEVLSSSLRRVGKAFVKKSGKQNHPEPCFLFDSHGFELDPSMSALEAWLSAAQLRIGSRELDVLCEPAEVLSLSLSTVPLVGVPLMPFVKTRDCDERHCQWTWERLPPNSIDGNAWQQVAFGREYVPSKADVGSRLRVRAKPPAPGRDEAALSFLAREAEAVEAVTLAPPRRLLGRRVSAMQNPRRADGFRVLSYNLLADCYSRHWDGRGSVHSYCSPQVTRAEWRMPRLLEEVLAFEPDIVLLQEVDAAWYEQHWAPALRSRGYEGIYTSKQHRTSSEGLAAFVRAEAFELIEARPLALSLDPNDAPDALIPLLETQLSTAAGVSKLPTVAQLLLLREASHTVASRFSQRLSPSPPSATPRHVLVANTHLYFSNPGMHVRLMQTAKLLHAAHQMMDARLPTTSPQALVVAGDLNSESTDAVLRLLTSGVVGAWDADWLHGALNWAPSLDLSSAAHDAARSLSTATLGDAVELGLEAQVEQAWAQQLRQAEIADEALALSTQQRASLEDARRIAHQLHLLRRAMERLLHGHSAATGTEVGDGGLIDLAAAIVHDHANGRTLLNSEALAAAEVARSLRLPLGAMTRSGRMCDGAHSWYTRAHTRLSELTQCLVEVKVALRARVASEVSSSVRWAVEAAGVPLTQPTPLASAYGLHSRPTHVVPGYANTLDWICFDAAQLDVVGVAPLPRLEELTREVAMPSNEWPSDHVSLCCDLVWKGHVEGRAGREVESAGAMSAPSASTSRVSGPWAAEGPRARPARSVLGSWIWRT